MAGEERDGRGSLDLAMWTHDGFRGAAEENQGMQHLGHDPEGVLESTGMRGGDEDHGQVGALAEALQDRAGHLPYGVCGDGILAYGCGKGHPTAR